MFLNQWTNDTNKQQVDLQSLLRLGAFLCFIENLVVSIIYLYSDPAVLKWPASTSSTGAHNIRGLKLSAQGSWLAGCRATVSLVAQEPHIPTINPSTPPNLHPPNILQHYRCMGVGDDFKTCALFWNWTCTMACCPEITTKQITIASKKPITRFLETHLHL